MSQYIDEPYLSGVLAGIVISVAAFWIVALANMLWRSALRPYAEAIPFAIEEAGFGASFAGEGEIDGRRVKVRLTAGFGGPKARVWVGEARHSVDLNDREPEGWFSEVLAS
ncbi:MAG TPA: hypothetical protein QGF58_05235 [Myxococcota bacterium]|nr:hypothetical protein [Myxococcota bacterium]